MKIPFTVLEFYLYVVFYLLHSAQKYSLPHVETKKKKKIRKETRLNHIIRKSEEH